MSENSMMFKKCVSQTIFVGLILLVFSLAIYSETDTGWCAEGEFDINVRRSAMGIPHWLIWNGHDVHGSPPQIDPMFLPDAEKYQTGFQFRPIPLIISIFGSLIIGLAFYGMRMCFGSNQSERLIRNRITGYVIVLLPIPVIGFAMFLPFGAAYIWGVGLCLFPIGLILATVVERNYLHSLGLGVTGGLAMWWVTRICDAFFDLQMSPLGREDLFQAVLFIAILLVVAFISTFVTKLVASRQKECTSGNRI